MYKLAIKKTTFDPTSWGGGEDQNDRSNILGEEGNQNDPKNSHRDQVGRERR